MAKKLHTGDDYQEVFDIDDYLNIVYEDPNAQKGIDFENRWLVELGKKGKIGGQSVLEIGTGPVLQNAVAVASYYDSIILSDFAAKNRNWLLNWWQGSSDSITKELIQQIIDLEGSGLTVKDKEKEVKKKLVAIVPSNIKIAQPLKPCIFRPFDTVIMRWVFNGAVRGAKEYATAIDNVASLIRTGGLLIVLGVADDEHQLNVRFQGCGLTPDEIKRVWEESQFEILEFHDTTLIFEGEVEYVFNLLARKV